MVITGWRAGVRTIDAVQAVHKHTDFGLRDSKILIETALSGKSVKLPDDFVLREDLEDCGFTVK